MVHQLMVPAAPAPALVAVASSEALAPESADEEVNTEAKEESS
jgi:hypothetical protein